jgi:hypothetical protein
MYGYRNHYQPRNQRFFGFGFGLPFLGGLAGGLLGTALFNPRPYYGYPPVCCPPVPTPFGYPGQGYPGQGYPGPGYPGYPYYR